MAKALLATIKQQNMINDFICFILVNNSKLKPLGHIEQINFDNDFDKLFKELYKLGIYSIMVESGSGFNSLLLKAGEVDEINHFFAPKIFGNGLNFVEGLNFNKIDEAIRLKDIKIKQVEDNFLINGKIKIY